MTTEGANSLPFFSANDRSIDPTDPVLRSLPQVGADQLPRPLPPPVRRADNMVGRFPMNLEPEDGSLLYSFTLDPASLSSPTKPPSVSESFGVLSAQVSPHYQHSSTPSVASDTEHSLEPPTQASVLVPESRPLDTVHTPDESNLEDNISSTSRDVTPTPEINCGLPVTPAEEDTPQSQDRPELGTLESPGVDLDLPLRRPSRLDSDFETSSVVSVQQLTDAYLNDPFDSAEEQLTAGTNKTSLPVVLPTEVSISGKSRSPNGGATLSDCLPKAVSDSNPVVPSSVSNELPQSSKLPPHIQSSPAVPVKRGHHDSTSLQPRSSTPSSETLVKELQDQLTEALQAKAHLEGQLDSVVNECKNTLQDRAGLQSKLGRLEAQLADTSEALDEEKQKSRGAETLRVLQPPSDTQGEIELLKEALEEARNALDGEKKDRASLRSELATGQLSLQHVQEELNQTQMSMHDQQQAAAALKQKVRDLQSELEKKTNEAEEAQCKSSSLEASYTALEGTKGWLHQQLQESLEDKKKLQEELREAKANGIAHCIKAEQLMKENTTFQDQISELQRGVLQEKARLVSELEAIEADVLSREDSYGHILAEKGQLEDVVKMKNNALDVLNSELARSQVATEELERKAEDLEMKNDVLAHQVHELGRSKGSLESQLHTVEQDLRAREAELAEMEQVKRSLQRKVRDAEAALTGKDGTIQGLNDAKEIMRQQLEMLREAKERVESELDDTKHELGKLENELNTVRDKSREKDAILRATTQSQHVIAAEKEGLCSQLMEKDRLLEEKGVELETLQSQSGELLEHFHNLKDQFHTIASREGDVQDSVAEKDRVISHLASERDSLEEELTSLRETSGKLQNKVEQLQQEKAHLEGQIDTPLKHLEEFQKLMQDKSEMQAELNSLKLSHQRDLIRAQTKASRLESDLKVSKNVKAQAQKELAEAVSGHEEEVCKLEEEIAHLKSDLRNAMSRLDDSVKATSSPQLHSNLRLAGERDRLRAEVDRLVMENKALSEQLEHEVNQKAEIERAGSVVAKNLKQNAQEKEKNFHEQIQQLTLHTEKLRGQLAGMELTQTAMREHAGGLEVALAKREAALLKLSAQAQRVLEEKELEDKDFRERIETLEKQLEDSRKAHQLTKVKVNEGKRKVAQLSGELSNKERELSELKEALEQTSSTIDDRGVLLDQVTELTTAKQRLESEVDRLSSQMLVTRTNVDSLSRKLADKEAQVGILTQELDMARTEVSEVKGELEQMDHQLKSAQEHHLEEVESLKRALGERRQESSGREGVAGGRGLFDASLSTIGVDETDAAGTTSVDESMGSDADEGKTVSKLLGYNSLYQAQLAEMGTRLEQARKQGQKVAEIKKSGEISALQEQLGSKSRTIHGLRTCLVSLKEDMGKLQTQMDRHSATMQASHVSTREIESQIESLKRSSTVPSPLFLSTPTNQSEC